MANGQWVRNFTGENTEIQIVSGRKYYLHTGSIKMTGGGTRTVLAATSKDVDEEYGQTFAFDIDDEEMIE